MSEFEIRSSRGAYAVTVGVGVAAGLGEIAAAIIDPAVEGILPLTFDDPVRVEAKEEGKTLLQCEQVMVGLNARGVRRASTVAAIGGGVIQDVATLSCSLYMRGIPWVYVPTTLMAMADSCIGGKSSINAGGVKNLVGNIYPPQKVLVDPLFVTGLPTRARVAGIAEAVKICFARGPEAFEAFVGSDAALDPGPDTATAELIELTLRAKKWFVEVDEFDRKERQLLNFGHSFGHAWEAACGFRVPHGVAVAIGMLAAQRHPAAARSAMSDELGRFATALAAQVKDEIVEAAAATDGERFRRALKTDKKNTSEHLRLVLPDGDGRLGIVELPLDERQLVIAEEALRSALEDIAS